ncbi:hypothetical protein Taro_006294, partial [Colocasia esculenta]|nr:hypothetical protein [Colocasia esculenta]
MEGEDNVPLYAKEQHRSNDPDCGTYLFGSSHMLGLDDWKPTESRLRIDGEPVVAAPQIPTRWRSYLDMCEELLGINILNLHALIPDTSGNEIHIQYLGFLEDFRDCGKLSWGSAVLAYLYRQLTWAALKKRRKFIGGCLHLLQLWCWERLHVAGPIPRPPLNPQDVSFGARWHRRLSRETPNRTWEFYRNEFDVIEESQIIWEPYSLEDLSRVGAICRENSQLWRARIPMFCMGVMEVHMPERVWRQFGAPQVIPPEPERYDRKDGRGHARENWLLYHARYIERWNGRANAILEPPTQEEEDQSQWHQWYGQQSNLYLTPFSEEPPTEYCPRGPIERALVDVTFRTRELLITNPEASYLDVKNDILKLQEDTLNKLRIKIPEYEQPSNPSGAEYTPGESSRGPNTWTHPWTSEPWPNFVYRHLHHILLAAYIYMMKALNLRRI